MLRRSAPELQGFMTDLDLVSGQLSQHFTLSVPVDAEVFNLQLLLSEEFLDLQKKALLTSKTHRTPS